MPVNEPFPELDEVIASIGADGHRIAAIDASEGAAGNISVCLGWPVEVRRRLREAAGRLAEFYDAADRLAEAEKWRAEQAAAPSAR